MYLIHDILRGHPKLLFSTFYPPSALEHNYAWHTKNQNKLDWKEKGSNSEKKKIRRKETGQRRNR